MTTDRQLQMELEEEQKTYFRKRSGRSYLYVGALVVVVVLCGLGIGLGVGYAVWYSDSTQTPQPNHQTQKPVPETQKPVLETQKPIQPTQEPVLETQKPIQPTQEPIRTTKNPAKRWIDTPCMSEPEPVCPPGVDRPPLILVSLDGFRADYLNRKLTDNIKKLSDCGTHAPYMLPSFPSVTFSNHYTIVTGLYPEHHGLIANEMYDPNFGKVYGIGKPEASTKKWYGGEPIWNTASKNGLLTGSYYWVGSDVDIQDMRQDYYFKYNGAITPEQKIATISGWLLLPTGQRPDFLTLYFDEPDHEAHQFGPDSPETNDQLKVVDRYIADLMDTLLAVKMHQCVNIVILADHGMANRSCEAHIILGKGSSMNFSTSEYYERDTAGCMMRYTPKRDAVLKNSEDIVNRLKCRDPRVIPYIKKDMPKRYHYMNNPRIEDVLIPVDQGYIIRNEGQHRQCDGGGHGYDNLARQMQALFLAYGPAFEKNLKIEPFQNIELFNMLCDVLGITPPPNDGEQGSLHHVLKNPPTLPPIDVSNYSTSLACPYPSSNQEYNTRLANDASMCSCTDELANVTTKPIIDFDKQLKLSNSDVLTSKAKHLLYGAPKVTFQTNFCELTQTDYITAYSHELKMPLYTAFTIEKKDSRSKAPSLMCTRPDVRVKATVSPNCSNYELPANETNMPNMTKGFLYSPGLTESLEAKMDALISSNLVPQWAGFIQDVWSGYLDEYMPKWADMYNGINVVTGPIFDYDFDGLRDTMEVLQQKGKKLGDTFVPSHYFVIVTRCSSQDASQPLTKDCSPRTPLAFILHNKDGIQNCQSQLDYMETNTARVKDVELLTGLRFYPDLERYEAIRLRTFNIERDHFFKYWARN